jgi:putative ABC transport system permease protein
MEEPFLQRIRRMFIQQLWRMLYLVPVMAIGLTIIGGRMGAWATLYGSMQPAYAATNPADMQIYGDSLDNEAVQIVRQVPGVIEAEGWGILWDARIQFPDDPDTWHRIDLYAVDDYENMDVRRITPVEGEWPPGQQQIVLERASAGQIGAEMGRMVVIDTPDGTRQELEFAGTAHDLATVPSDLSLWLQGFVSMETLQMMGHDGIYRRIFIDVEESYMEHPEDAEELLNVIVGQLERSGFSTQGYISDDEHWASSAINVDAWTIAIPGGAALLMAAVLVMNAAAITIRQQISHVSVSQAREAKRWQAFLSVLFVVTMLALPALLCSVPSSALMANIFARSEGALLNVDITRFHFPLYIIGLQLLIVVGLPILVATIPTLLGMRPRIREALLGTEIELPDRQSRPIAMAWKNALRHKGRLALTLLVTALCGMLFIVLYNLRGAVLEVVEGISSLFDDSSILVTLDDYYDFAPIEQVLLDLPGVSYVEPALSDEASLILEDGAPGESWFLVAVLPDSAYVAPSALAGGRWLQPGDTNTIVVTQDLLTEYHHLTVGSEITLRSNLGDRTWEIIGIIPTPADTAFVSYDYYTQLINRPDQTFLVAVGIDPNSELSTQTISNGIRERLQQAGCVYDTLIESAGIARGNIVGFQFAFGSLLGTALPLSMIGGFCLSGMLQVNVLERTHGIRLMRAHGLLKSPGFVVWLEGVLIGGLGIVLGLGLSFPAIWLLLAPVGNRLFFDPNSLSFHFAPQGVFIWLMVMVPIVIIASLPGAIQASSISALKEPEDGRNSSDSPPGITEAST